MIIHNYIISVPSVSALFGRRGEGAAVERGRQPGEARRASDDAPQHERRRRRRRVQDRGAERQGGRLLHHAPRPRGALSQARVSVISVKVF